MEEIEAKNKINIMNRLDLSNLGGLPFTQDRLDFLQQSYLAAFGALAKLCGDKVILTGVELAAGNVSDGWIAYNGELIKFIGGAYADQIVITETAVPFTFGDASVHDVQFTKIATCGLIGAFDFAELTRADTIKQFIADFVAHTHDWADITNKPAGYITHVGQHNIGDIIGGGAATFTVTIPDQGGNAYKVIATIKSNDNNYSVNNDLGFCVYDFQATTFKVAIDEFRGGIQNISLDFIIVKS